MALVKPVIFQVAGYQNSGKTTFSVKLIESLKAIGLKTAVIKHHGHGGKPETVVKKDSTKHLEAGAAVSIVEGGGRLIVQAEDCEYSLKEQIELMEFFHPDVIIIEGYKLENYPKLLLIRGQEDLSLLKKVSNVVAIVYWEEEVRDSIIAQMNVPCFTIRDYEAVRWVIQYFKKSIHKIDGKN